jgi:hypothetical protein
MTPKRIQRKRTKGWRTPPGAVYVGRPTKYGNPYRVEACGGGRREAVDLFEQLVRATDRGIWKRLASIEEIQRELRGKDLMCFCPLDQPCHADLLLKIANAPETYFIGVDLAAKVDVGVQA